MRHEEEGAAAEEDLPTLQLPVVEVEAADLPMLPRAEVVVAVGLPIPLLLHRRHSVYQPLPMVLRHLRQLPPRELLELQPQVPLKL